MLSKWQIWDFFSTNHRNNLKSHFGINAIKTFDPISLKLLKDYIFKEMNDITIIHKLGSEITKSWIEEEFHTLSLFGNSDSFFIHQAHDISNDVWDMLSALDLQDRFIILSFENEHGPWKKIAKEGKVPSIVIEEPKFWEFNKLLDFVCSYLRLPLSFEAKGWLLDSLENDLGTFYHACWLLKMNFPSSSEITLDEVKELLVLEKLDQFQLASFFSRKKYDAFYSRLLSLEGDFDKMRSLFMFMQSHLIKMIDSSYLNQKSRLTQYDKEIQNTSKLWTDSDLMNEIERFNEWEILSKKKNGLLWGELKKRYLRSM